MNRVHFIVNGKPYSVGSETSSDVTLLDYLRQNAKLSGTKYMCREGGCGACLVSAIRPGALPGAVNTCLVSIMSCQGWDITTIEQIGNKKIGYHPLQRTLAQCNGSQCGYCSPGWIMAMYSLLKSKRNLTMLEIEQSFGSNVCRCTGYRPILDAFKQFASDAPKPNRLLDIEDLHICMKTGESCKKRNCSESDWCFVNKDEIADPQILEIDLKDGRMWFKVQSTRDVFKILNETGDDSYMLVAGNTAKGAYPIDNYPRILIDISDVVELKGYFFDQNLVLGAGLTLTETINIFQNVAASQDYFEYLETLRQHLLMVAHIPVRNLGTLAGNLMIKHQHHDFQSDVYLLLETVGAELVIIDGFGSKFTITPKNFLTLDMRGKIILNIIFPPLTREYSTVTFKIMPKSQNAHATVHAGFMYKMSAQNAVVSARIVFGGISNNFDHAFNTEMFLIGRQLFTNETLQGALNILNNEIVVTENPPEPSATYRKDLALGLFYKGLLQLCPESLLDPRFRTGAVTLAQSRPASSGRQSFQTDPALWPLNQPVQKVEALAQCAGETQYTDDIPEHPHEVFGALVLSAVALGDITSIDPSNALKQPGVLAFYSAKDIPGKNSFINAGYVVFSDDEEIFCNGSVKYHSQVIGIIAAETRHIAENAAKLVNVEYVNVNKPVIDIKEAKTDPNRMTLVQAIDATERGTDVYEVINGEQTVYSQIHFCIEVLVSVTAVTEEGFKVNASTQYLDSVQHMISRALEIPQHKIDVQVRYLGGAYGQKISRTTQLAVACALVSKNLSRPCRLVLPLQTLTKAIGKRCPASTDYEVAVNKRGQIQYVNENIYEDNGYVVDEQLISLGLGVYNNCYNKPRWSFKAFNSTTDTASNTWFRSPGNLEIISSTEFIMERIACELSLDPLQVKLDNIDSNYTVTMQSMIEQVTTEGDYYNRRVAVDQFNAENRWKKRGLRFTLMRWQPATGRTYAINMAVYHYDGTVALTHSGIEIGQGGSFASVCIGIGVQRACEELLKRLEPVRANMPGATWEQVIQAAFEADIDLQTHGFVNENDAEVYDIFGVTLAEVEVDILTGEHELLRVDLLQDAGQSVSPEIDIGQTEGAFVMGVGYWTSEHLVYDKATGELLTDRTWNYYVPQARDIPRDFRVYLKKNSYSVPKILGAKSIGEAPLCMSVAVPLAIREAVASARLEAGIPINQWFQIDGPYTREAIQLATETKYTQYKFN